MTAIKKIFFSIIIFGVLTIFLIIFCIFPFLKQIQNNSKEFISEKKKVILLTQKREKLQELENFYKTYQSDYNKIENLFIDSQSPIEFIQFLEQTATNSGVQLEILSTKISQKTKEDFWPSLSFQLSLSGDFPDFLKFLRKLENSPYLIEFLDLNIKKESKIKAELSIKVFSK